MIGGGFSRLKTVEVITIFRRKKQSLITQKGSQGFRRHCLGFRMKKIKCVLSLGKKQVYSTFCIAYIEKKVTW